MAVEQAKMIAASLNISEDTPTTKVELSICARNLPDMDILSKSDPVCILYTKRFGQEEWCEYGRTEVIQNTLNPDFEKTFVVDFYFEQRQQLKFAMYDIDDTKNQRNLKKQDYMGCFEISLGTIVGCGSVEKPLTGGPTRSKGTVKVTSEKQISSKDVVLMTMCGEHLDKKDLFGKSDPFLLFYKKNEQDDGYSLVHRTEVIKRTLNPQWKEIAIPVTKFCNGDDDRQIKVQCYDHDFDGGHDLIGEFTTDLRTLSRGPCPQNEHKLIHPKKKEKKGQKYSDSGIVKLQNYSLITEYTVLDYIRSGIKIQISMSIDMTSSNGDPSSPTSLHYTSDVPNSYMAAMKAVYNVIEPYDSDKMIALYGFGAMIPPDFEQSDLFALVSTLKWFKLENGNSDYPYCKGIDEVLQAYRSMSSQVKFYGPTNFAPTINRLVSTIQTENDNQKYHILLILTDGVISDIMETKKAIVQSSMLPLSIIIVGIGNEDFEAMKILDGDVDKLSYKGKVAERDIVQFVAFNDCLKGKTEVLSSEHLSREVLAEVPEQLLSYMKNTRRRPSRKFSKHALVTAV